MSDRPIYVADVFLDLLTEAEAAVLYFHKDDDPTAPACVLITGERWLTIGSLIEEMGRADLLIGPVATGKMPHRDR